MKLYLVITHGAVESGLGICGLFSSRDEARRFSSSHEFRSSISEIESDFSIFPARQGSRHVDLLVVQEVQYCPAQGVQGVQGVQGYCTVRGARGVSGLNKIKRSSRKRLLRPVEVGGVDA